MEVALAAELVADLANRLAIRSELEGPLDDVALAHALGRSPNYRAALRPAGRTKLGYRAKAS